MNFNFYMTYYLVKKGYTNILEVPANELVSGLTSYLMQELKLKETKEDIFSLYKRYASIVKEPEKSISAIIRYLLGYISLLQQFEITWEIKENIEPTLINNDKYPEKIDHLISSINIDENLFALVLNTALEYKEKREEGLIRWLN